MRGGRADRGPATPRKRSEGRALVSTPPSHRSGLGAADRMANGYEARGGQRDASAGFLSRTRERKRYPLATSPLEAAETRFLPVRRHPSPRRGGTHLTQRWADNGINDGSRREKAVGRSERIPFW